jgi:nitrite reductase/ring-hydroxylating ferredoxin subunit
MSAARRDTGECPQTAGPLKTTTIRSPEATVSALGGRWAVVVREGGEISAMADRPTHRSSPGSTQGDHDRRPQAAGQPDEQFLVSRR